jgi:very-short-patch-repair endonuclease
MQGVRRNTSAIRTSFVEPLIAELAARQHGVVARRQLAALGLKPTAIARRVRAGRLHRVHASVYAVGHPVLGRHGRWMAATLACGNGAVLSHVAAAALWELRPSAAVFIDVSVPTPGGRQRAGLRIHRGPSLTPDEVTTKDGIAVTTPARTLLDLAAELPERELHRALDQAEIQELTDYPSLDALARAHAGHRGGGKLLRALAEHDAGTTLTRSELEERFVGLCRRHGLPQPRVNAYAAGLEVDFLFPDARLVVETDGFRYHRTRAAFERDRRRDQTLAVAGYRVLRFTHRQIAEDQVAVARTLSHVARP